ncbi:hypothetical protein BsWGS_17444 [Bradybaena similaris]
MPLVNFDTSAQSNLTLYTTERAVSQVHLQHSTLPYTVIFKPTLASRTFLVSDETFAMFSLVVDDWICMFLAVVGAINNIICIVIFATQGFKDTVNITMTTIAFWEVMKLSCAIADRLAGPIKLFHVALGTSWKNIVVATIRYFQGICGNISYMMAAYVAIERSICVCFPFDVKRYFTPKLTAIICVSISISVLGSLITVLFIFEIVWVYREELSASVAVYQYSTFFHQHGAVFMNYYKLIAFFYPMISLFTMVVSTCIITHQLQKSSRFRLKGLAPGSAQGDLVSGVEGHGRARLTARDRQIVKLLLVLISAYICNLTPRFVHFLTSLLVPEYYFLRLYNNIFWCVVYSVYVMDYLNSSSMLLIYFSMSSNFRETAKRIFHPPCPAMKL